MTDKSGNESKLDKLCGIFGGAYEILFKLIVPFGLLVLPIISMCDLVANYICGHLEVYSYASIVGNFFVAIVLIGFFAMLVTAPKLASAFEFAFAGAYYFLMVVYMCIIRHHHLSTLGRFFLILVAVLMIGKICMFINRKIYKHV